MSRRVSCIPFNGETVLKTRCFGMFYGVWCDLDAFWDISRKSNIFDFGGPRSPPGPAGWSWPPTGTGWEGSDGLGRELGSKPISNTLFWHVLRCLMPFGGVLGHFPKIEKFRFLGSQVTPWVGWLAGPGIPLRPPDRPPGGLGRMLGSWLGHLVRDHP